MILDALSQKHAAKSWSTKRLLLTNIGSLGSIVWSCLTVFIPGRQHVSFFWKQKQREREREREQLLHAAVRRSCMKTKNVCILPYQAPNCFRMLQPFHASSSSMFEDESWRCMTHSFDKSSANIHFWMYCLFALHFVLGHIRTVLDIFNSRSLRGHCGIWTGGAGIPACQWSIRWCDPYSGALKATESKVALTVAVKQSILNKSAQTPFTRARVLQSLSGGYSKGPHLDPCNLSQFGLDAGCALQGLI